MLTSDAQPPEMSQATMSANFLQPLQIIPKLGVHTIGKNLRVLAVHNIPLPVQEPRRDFELCWVLNYRDNSFQLVGVEIASPG
jgi:hypothetical protein